MFFVNSGLTDSRFAAGPKPRSRPPSASKCWNVLRAPRCAGRLGRGRLRCRHVAGRGPRVSSSSDGDGLGGGAPERWRWDHVDPPVVNYLGSASRCWPGIVADRFGSRWRRAPRRLHGRDLVAALVAGASDGPSAADANAEPSTVRESRGPGRREAMERVCTERLARREPRRQNQRQVLDADRDCEPLLVKRAGVVIDERSSPYSNCSTRRRGRELLAQCVHIGYELM